AGTGFCSASSGNQMRAASIVPSFNGINVCSMTRTVFGKFVTITATLQLGRITELSGAVNRYAGPLTGRRLTRLITTHFHPDHIGLTGWLSERFELLADQSDDPSVVSQYSAHSSRARYQKVSRLLRTPGRR